MKYPLQFKEFNITHNLIPENIATKILYYHIQPGMKVREDIGLALWPSENSCWRPFKWEIKHNRDGDSQHCFGQNEFGKFDDEAKGACDWTCTDFQNNKEKLLKSLIDNTEYTRMAVYDDKGFIHSDYKKTTSGKREVYNQEWERQFKIG